MSISRTKVLEIFQKNCHNSATFMRDIEPVLAEADTDIVRAWSKAADIALEMAKNSNGPWPTPSEVVQKIRSQL